MFLGGKFPEIFSHKLKISIKNLLSGAQMSSNRLVFDMKIIVIYFKNSLNIINLRGFLANALLLRK